MLNDKLIKQCNRLMFLGNKYKLENKNVLFAESLTLYFNKANECFR